MRNWLLLLVFGLACSANAATLIPEQGVSVLYIDGVETASSIGQKSIDSGEVELIIRMDKELGRGNSKAFTSAPYVLTFKVTGKEVKIKLPQARSHQEAERAFRDNEPQWTIFQDGESVPYQQELLPPKDGLFPYLGMNSLVVDYYSNKNTDVTKEQTAVVTNEGGETSKEVSDIQATSNLIQLKAWYLQSTTEERKAFRRWMIDQE